MAEDGWIETAMNDVSVVAELLVRLKHSDAQPSSVLKWGAKQRRRSTLRQKKREWTRASPTTPLSWSAGTSSNSGGGGDEESSRPHRLWSTSGRSKVSTSETGKRAKNKKKFVEVQEEESFLRREKEGSKRNDLAFPSVQQSYNPFLLGETATFGHNSTNFQANGRSNCMDGFACSSPAVDSQMHSMKRELLPDLNLPLEEDSCSDVLYGMS